MKQKHTNKSIASSYHHHHTHQTSNPNNDKRCQLQNTHTISCKSVLIASILTIIAAFSLFICVYDREVCSTLQTLRSCKKKDEKETHHVRTASFIGIIFFKIHFTFKVWQRFSVGKCCQLATDGKGDDKNDDNQIDHKVLELYSSRSLSLHQSALWKN